MRRNPRRGAFVTFEGGEGAGKSTQGARLKARLEGLGIETITTREPGGSPHAEAIRHAILSGAVAPLGPFAEALMFSAARLDHIETTIRPALERGAFVVCDRFIDSTRVYQGALGHIEPGLIASLEEVIVGDLMPDLTLILDVAPATGLARATLRRGGEGTADRFERETLAFHEGLRAAFLSIAAGEPERCRVIDADQDPDRVAEAVWAEMLSRFDELRRSTPTTLREAR